jgi:hypothetical protein
MTTLQAAPPETEEKSLLDEMVSWVNVLKQAGVSPDKAAEVSKDIIIAIMNTYPEEFSDDYDDDEEYDDDEGDEEE